MDLPGQDRDVPALWDHVDGPVLCTRIRNAGGTSVGTIEHLMAALAGCGIHNALIEIDGPEVPILDGSARRFAQGILAAGVSRLDAPLTVLCLRQAVTVHRGDAYARLEPASRLGITFRIEFDDPAIGVQECHADMANGRFLRDFCDSRTFCRKEDVDSMRLDGLALGGSYENALVFDDGRVLNPEGLLHPDEPVRHKVLDALGDLATAGRPLIAHYTGHKAGHALTNRLLREVFADPANWDEVACTPQMARRLPGSGLLPTDLAAVA